MSKSINQSIKVITFVQYFRTHGSSSVSRPDQRRFYFSVTLSASSLLCTTLSAMNRAREILAVYHWSGEDAERVVQRGCTEGPEIDLWSADSLVKQPQ